ncbi:hypothetical protein [Smaragdicoccus niigatensis]|uniref:hypothetical protein n=1 Tax=Smaragdicoccus niigatensis TaxID=359359 RepID=UPI000367EDEA|nr:hypothetical protein [Smaragdicoccus niigatensis]
MVDFEGAGGVDLRALLDDAIGKIEPLLKSAAAAQSEQTPCTWCPICRAANAVKGHEQDLFASIATQGGALLSVLKDAMSGLGTPEHKPAETAPAGDSTTEFTEIPITIKP